MLEAGLSLKAVEYIVFDEADRLFEMGLAEQIHQIIAKLPESRQTVMFSATLPQMLVDFARAGLTNPELIRLDTETQISETMKVMCPYILLSLSFSILGAVLYNKSRRKE
jgi:ATP-dependent RNA helicase DDX54/DBP10